MAEFYKLLAFILWTPLGVFSQELISGTLVVNNYLWVRVPAILFFATVGLAYMLSGRKLLIEWRGSDDTTRCL